MVTKTKSSSTEYRTELRDTERLKADLTLTVDRLNQSIEEHESLTESGIVEYKEEEMKDLELEVNRKYKPQLQALDKEIEELEELIAIKSTNEESVDLIAAREKQAYLDKAAIVLETLRIALEKASHPHFVSLAYNEKKLSMSKYRKLFSTMENRIDEIQEWNMYTARPFSIVENKEQEKGYNKVNYLYSILYSPYILWNIFPALNTVIKRNQTLHKYAQFYHTLMFNTIRIRVATAEQIEKLFSDLVDIKQQSLNEKLQELRDKWDALDSEKDKALSELEVDSSAYEISQDEILKKYEVDLRDAKEKIVTFSNRINELKVILSRLDSEYTDALEVEREPYIKSGNEAVVLPPRLLFDYSRGGNKLIDFKEGLYLFEERDEVFQYIRLIIYQIRNYMKWGTYHFRLHDLLRAEELLDLQLDDATNSDITIYSLKNEKRDMVEVLHDLHKRRSKQISSVAQSIGEFNLLASEQDSSLVGYNIVMIYDEDKLELSEELIQLLNLGPRFGIIVMIFVPKEKIDSRVLRTYSSFIKNTTELTDSGLTQHDTKEFIYELEYEESDSN